MLLRAAGRRPHRKPPSSLVTDLQQIHLPFLWPAHLRWSTTHTSSPSRPPRTTNTAGLHDTKLPHIRHLASVAGHAELLPSTAYEPFNYTPATNTWSFSHPSTNDLLILPNEEPQHPTSRRSALGNNGHDLLQNLYACLRVGRFDRAQSIIKRLTALPDVPEADVLHAHETYLEAFLDSPEYSDPEERFEQMVDHYKRHHLDRSKDPAYASMVVMRAALALPHEDKQRKEVKRFAAQSRWSFADLEADDIWTDREYNRLGPILRDAPIDESIEVTGLELSGQGPSLQKSEYKLSQRDLPQILQVHQRGVGLLSLKETLSVQEKHYAESGSKDSQLDVETALLRNTEREKLLEDTASEAAVRRWKAEEEQLQSVGINSALNNRSINAMMWRWYTDLVPQLEKEIASIKQRMTESPTGAKLDGPREDADYIGAYLEQMTPQKLAVNTVITLMSTLAREKDHHTDEYMNSVRVTDVAKNLGYQIESEVVAELVRKERHNSQALKRKRGKALHPQARANARMSKAELARHTEWPLQVKIRIGAMLVSKFIEVAKMPITREHPRTKQSITRMRPAFSYKMTYIKGKRQNLLTCCPELREKIRKEPVGGVIYKKLPMLVEPIPWTDYKSGGYLNYPTDFVRVPANDRTPKEYVKAAVRRGHMKNVFSAITALGKTAWHINEDVLRVQIDAWNSGEAVGNFAPLEPKFDVPPEPAPSGDPHIRSKWIAEMQEIENKKTGLHSQRCHQNLQLEIARSFRHDRIYFPHNVDFRGRAYPLSVYLNHMNADNVRGLLTFAEGKELGEGGLRWLKIHLANVFGYDKASFSEREQFVMDHLDDIYDSANNPLTGRQWWRKSEDAWQTLAACYELKHALDSADPTKYHSRLPIHQDGTCNGLQHYAALGGDEAGARQVNLVPGDRPSDVYTAVAEGVISSIKEDLANGNPIAKILDGRITRKVVKQPVMTNVYGVSFFGAKAQVKKQIEDIFPEIRSGDLINHQTLASYIARKIFGSLGEMFKGAQAIQEWLGRCADRIATSVTPEQIGSIQALTKAAKSGKTKKTRPNNSFKSTVIWTTPLQFPVVQPYRDAPTKILKTSASHISITEPESWDPVHRRKQLQGFPPNFIHSLDATHMMLSAIKCEEKGITFASIHDSFWTHACDRDELSELLRDAFVHMHREDIIGRLKEEFEARYKGCMYQACIDSLTPIGKKIAAWRKGPGAEMMKKYKKLDANQRELVLENERLKLLASEVEADRQKGEEMVTPATIFQEEGGWEALVPPTGLASQRLGHAIEGEVDADLDGDFNEALKANVEDAETAEELQEFEAEKDAEEEQEEARLTDTQLRAKMLGGKLVKKTTYTRKKSHIWLPLTFPDVPQKGKFDVRTLRESKYFFH
ncbi:DNA-dependent RNA polymerase-like protein [Elsinoe fawcettii]|nr:DNA-dependent RNA polymerase-like protein [Elsinoe fawcettii]